jgi:DNA (cytosine-5)-methyltransferase 1
MALARPQFTLGDLFAGCGGMTRGFLDSGDFTSVFAVEVNSDAAKTYRENFGDHVTTAGIETVEDFPAVDVLIGGPPCQAFSPLNRDSVGFSRRTLWREYARALEDSEASAFVMENVPQLLQSDEYRQFKKKAKKLGYFVDETILNAADYGVPQIRKRAIAIGSLFGPPPWPGQTHCNPNDPNSSLPPWRTFREAVEGLPMKPNMAGWHRPRNPRPESIRRYKAVPRDGGNRFQMQRNLDRAGLEGLVPACWRNKPTGTTDVFGRLWWDRPAFTIRTEFYKPEKGRYLHPSAHRPITVREAARCMGFEDDFILPEDQSMTSVAKQIGNAVPPPLAKAVAGALSEHLRQHIRTAGTEVECSLQLAA